MDVVIIVILLIEVVGFGMLAVVVKRMKQQIGALKGTVDAQAETLKTVGDLNKIALEMARAFDPKKYADAVNTYQELADKNANATVEDARRAFQLEQRQTEDRAKKAVEALISHYTDALKAGYRLVAYVPPEQRRIAIEATELPEEVRQDFHNLAASAPDLSCSTLQRLVLGDYFGASVIISSPLLSSLPPASAPPPPSASPPSP